MHIYKAKSAEGIVFKDYKTPLVNSDSTPVNCMGPKLSNQYEPVVLEDYTVSKLQIQSSYQNSK